MNRKTGVIIAVIGSIIYLGIIMFQKSPEEKYEQFKKQTNSPRNSIPYEQAYLLKTDFKESSELDTLGNLKYDIKDALMEELNKCMKPYGVNKITYNNSNVGALGIVKVIVSCQIKKYRSSSGMHGGLPTYISIELALDNYTGSSTWDTGIRESVTVKVPSSIGEGSFASTRRKHVFKAIHNVFKNIIEKYGDFKRN